MVEAEEIVVDGVTYVKKDGTNEEGKIKLKDDTIIMNGDDVGLTSSRLWPEEPKRQKPFRIIPNGGYKFVLRKDPEYTEERSIFIIRRP